MTTRTIPRIVPRVSPTPEIDPDTRLNPDRLCPHQKEKVVRAIP
jgi:hypothetical protein